MLLSGLRVLELGGGIAGSAAGAVLADLGAAVTTVQARSAAVSGEGTYDLLMSDLDRHKAVVPSISAVEDDSWHVVLDDRLATGLADAPVPASMAQVPRAYVLITAFGAESGHEKWTGSEFVALAAGGGLRVICGRRGEPVPSAGWQAMLSTGYVAALAALDALNIAKSASDLPVVTDVSARDAVAFTFTYLECAHGLFRCPGTSGGRRYTAPTGIFRTRDGRIRLAAVDEHQWSGARAAFGEPEWAAPFRTVEDRRDHANELNEYVEAWTRKRAKADLADLLQRHGVPATAVNTPGEVLASPHLWERGYFTEAEGRLGHRPPFTLETSNTAAVHDPSFWDHGHGRTLQQVTIAEATHVISAPIAGALVGAMGAKVIRLEDVDRLDMYRRIGPFADGVPGLESGAYFLAANVNKDSLAFSASDLEPVHQVLRSSDVILENVRASRLARWKIDLPSLAAEGRLTVSVSGFGRTGPLADYRAYANNVHAYAGFAEATRTSQGQFANIYTVLADIATSLVTALVITAWAIGPCSGNAADADIAMLEVMVARLTDRLMAARQSGSDHPPWSLREPGAVLNDIFGTSDGAIALTVRDDRDWAVLSELLGLASGRWTTSAARAADRSHLRRLLARRLKAAQADSLAAALQERGVPAAKVMAPSDLYESAELRNRGLFRQVPHRDRGSYWSLCQPWRLIGRPDREWRGAPVLGSLNLAAGLPMPSSAEAPVAI